MKYLQQYLILACAAVSAACTPLTQVEDVTEQNALPARPLQTVLLIGVTGDDATRRRYENRCQEAFADMAMDAPRVISSHEIFPDGNSLTRDTVMAWLDSNDQVEGVLVMQLAAIMQQQSSLQAGGVSERYGLNLAQPGLTWNYQPDPSTTLPDHQSALTQSTLYVRPDHKIALTVMARTDIHEKLTRMADSHCDALRSTLAARGWL